MSKEWFVIQFKANLQNQAAKNLKQQGFETFLPLYDISSRKASRFINNTRPLFPGYMFITFNKANTDWHKINNTYGVSRLITFNSILKSIPNTVVENLMARCDLSGKLIPSESLKKGDRVKISKGPFESFIASVEKYETDQRIWILMGLMGRKSKIQVGTKDIQLEN